MHVIRCMLMPFSFLFGMIVSIRNKCYDAGIYKSYRPEIKSICVGNLSVGGTGKTPLVAYIAELLVPFQKTAILSRGYGRKSRGFHVVLPDSNVITTGDEPLMYAKKFQEKVQVAVCENRVEGIHKLLQLNAVPELVILDDAFQHRSIQAECNILVTEFDRPFFNDYLIPTGRLRESVHGAKRAQLLVVTKCPEVLSEDQQTDWIERSGFEHSKVFFSRLQYDPLIEMGKKVQKPEHAVLVTGIGNPNPLRKYAENFFSVTHVPFPDHHAFTRADVLKIHEIFGKFAHKETILLTTEKDWMRLACILTKDDLHVTPWYIQPISLRFDKQEDFNQIIKQYARTI